ncbi:MAG: ABC transporter permease [Candidatus Berkelbacteria bacterium]|nr:ABC transporter permease [Candidatus Berkelbacteria bacterium]
MGVISRGTKNAFRNGVRSLSVILILSIAIGLTLVMYMSLQTVQAKIDSVKSNIGNTITVSPAGIRGFEGGGDLLSQDSVSKISQIDNVTKVVSTLMDHLTDNTNLQPAQEAGGFGRRQQMGTSSNTITNSNQTESANHDFKMPIMISATNDLSTTLNLNVSKFDITSGEKFDAGTSDNVALIGTSLASKNNLASGSTFQAYDKDVKVVGIVDTGNTFGNSQIFMPIRALQTLSGQTDQINSVLVQVASVDKIDAVQTKLKDQFQDKADIVSSQDTSKQAVAPLENIKTISLYCLIGSLIAGGIILFLTMIMIVRERRREIGVLKAIGASNLLVTTQFAVEALVLTISSSIVGIILGTFLSNPILKVLVSNNTETAGRAGQGAADSHMMMMRVGAGIINGAQGALRDLSATVGISIILYGLLAAIVIAILGSVIPSFIIAKISPAEVMRSE